MSEYQYYEFLAIDRPLDARQQRELRVLSTRARIISTRLVNTYHWGDFKGDPRLVMSRYFDAFLYLANRGTRQLMFRLPTALLDLETASRCCASGSACAWTDGDHVIVELTSEKEDDDWEEGAEDSLSSIIPVRSELAGGDRRLLYLAWLLSVDAGESKDNELEPAVPPGLATLSAALQSFVEFLRLDEDLLSVAAEASKPLDPIERSAAELTGWVTRLPAEEKDALLARLASGDPHLGMELARRFRGEREQRPEAFDRRLVELRQQHSKKQSLLQRLERAGLGAGPGNLGGGRR